MRIRLFASVATFLICLWAACGARAHEEVHGDLRIAHPWVADAGGGVVYGYAIEIDNKGNGEERLVGATLDAGGDGTLRSSSDDNGVRKFAPVENGLAIAPGKSIELAPGKLQIFFPKFSGILPQSGSVEGKLIFEKAGAVPVHFMIEPTSAAEPDVPSAGEGGQKKHEFQDHHEHHEHHN